jgi:hypothetical protein
MMGLLVRQVQDPKISIVLPHNSTAFSANYRSYANGIELGGDHDFHDGFTLILGLSSISRMYGYQKTHRRGGHQIVPTRTTILQCLSGEWAALLQPEAILTVCRELG